MNHSMDQLPTMKEGEQSHFQGLQRIYEDILVSLLKEVEEW